MQRFFAVVLLGILALIPAGAQASSTYAPERGWHVANWFGSTPYELNRFFPSHAQALSTDWITADDSWNGPQKAACNPGDARFWLYLNSFNHSDAGGNYEDLAGSSYLIVECDGSGSSGPWNNGSSAANYWRCADGEWRYPHDFPGQIELCEQSDTDAEPEKNKGP